MCKVLVSLANCANLEKLQPLSALGCEILATSDTQQALAAFGLNSDPYELMTFETMEQLAEAECDQRMQTLKESALKGETTEASYPLLVQRVAECKLRPSIEEFDLIFANLYPAGQKPRVEGFKDFGRATMIEAAINRMKYSFIVVDPADYEDVVKALTSPDYFTREEQFHLTQKASEHIILYDLALANWFSTMVSRGETPLFSPEPTRSPADPNHPLSLPLSSPSAIPNQSPEDYVDSIHFSD